MNNYECKLIEALFEDEVSYAESKSEKQGRRKKCSHSEDSDNAKKKSKKGDEEADVRGLVIPLMLSKESAAAYGKALYAAYSHGILTNKELRASAYYADFFLASFHLARSLVRDAKSKLKAAKTLNAFDNDDWSQSFAIILVKKYETIVRALRGETVANEEHNHKAYCSRILDNYLTDCIRRTYVKTVVETVDENGVKHHTSEVVEEIDANGVKHKKQISECSSNTTLKEDEKGITTLQDLFVSAGRTPEEEHLFNEENEASCRRIHEHLRWLKSKKNKGRLFAFVEVGLHEDPADCRARIKAISHKCAMTPTEIVAIYNQDFRAYAHAIHLPEEEIEEYLAEDFSELGFTLDQLKSDTKFRDMVAKWKNRNKEELEKRLEKLKKQEESSSCSIVRLYPVNSAKSA